MANELNDDLSILDDFFEKRLKDHDIQTYDDFKNTINNINCTDLKKSVQLLKENILNNKKIVGIHDSDVDGLSTAALSYRFFNKYIKYRVVIDITDRTQGYGFLPLHVDKFPDADLFYTADNGITSSPACKYAKEKNKKIIICDHHQPEVVNGEQDLPDADAIFDFMLNDCNFKFKEVSGAVTHFILLWHLLKEFGFEDKLDEYYKDNIDLIALTTISDVMPLDISINRFMVNDFLDHNFESLNDEFHQYVKTYKRIHNDSPNSEDLAFTLIPALNATQRMSSALYGFHYLIQNDIKQSEKLFNYIFDLNNKRKLMQSNVVNYIETYYKDWIKDKKFIIIPGDFRNKYKGLLGIAAGKLAEKYKRPCIVLDLNRENNIYSGSGRSVSDINILKIFRDIRETENGDKYFSHLGGHKQALGLGIKKEYLNEITLKIYDYMENNFSLTDFYQNTVADFYVSMSTIDINGLDIYNKIEEFKPFGQRFKKPIFKTQCIIKNIKYIGKEKNHASLIITDKNGIIKLKAMWFFYDDKLKRFDNSNLYHIFWVIDVDSYDNNKIMLKIIDIETAKK